MELADQERWAAEQELQVSPLRSKVCASGGYNGIHREISETFTTLSCPV